MLETTYSACVACFRESGLQDHHIEPRSHFGSQRRDERDDPKNKATLCFREHDDFHAKRLFLVRDTDGSCTFVRRSIAELFVNWDNACRAYAAGSVDDYARRERAFELAAKSQQERMI